jgi:hypothetical protein
MDVAAEKPPAMPGYRSGVVAGRWDSLIPPWPFVLGLLIFARLLAERLALLNDPDTYLHIAAGRWILAHRALPLHDPFSHSMRGASWLPSEWLAELALAAGYDGFGWVGVILIAAASVAIAVALLMHFLQRRLEALPALIATAAGAALLLPHALVRPHILILPLLVLWSGTLFAARDNGRGPPFLLLPVMVLWANLHGSFMFGLALAAYLGTEAVLQPGAGRTRRVEALRWAPFIAAAIGAALLTPLGAAGLWQPVRLAFMPVLQSTFSEWLSPDFQKSPALELWILGVIVVGFTTGARLPPTRVLLLAGLVHLTLQHVRHADLLALVGPLAVAAPLGRHLAALAPAAEPSRLAAWFARLAQPPGLPALAVTLAAAAALALPTALHPILRTDDPVTPAAALAAAQRLDLSGPVYNSEKFGGYLAFRGIPTFIDGRIEMYGGAFLKTDYLAERGDAAAIAEILARYRISWALLAPESGAALALDRLPGWQRAYGDNRAVIYRRLASP